jgi:hypothetical protein
MVLQLVAESASPNGAAFRGVLYHVPHFDYAHRVCREQDQVGEVPVTSRYAASDSTGLLCAEIEPTGGSPPGESGEDRSLENVVITHSHSQNKRERREIRKSTDQKRTDLSELLDTSSPRDGTTRSVLTKSSCASVDEIIALVLEETSQKLSLDQQQARGGTAHIRVPNLDGLHLEASRR